MFFSGSKQQHPDVDALLAPFLYLDKSLFKNGDDGDACFKKYSNEGRGVALRDRAMLTDAATAIRAGEFKPANWIEHVDVFVLYANAIDQQRFNEKPSPKEKETLVLNYLEAAFHLSPKYDYDNLGQYSPRELSSHAQLIHYLGKARRYAGVSAEERLPMLENALKIATHLSTLGCSEADDPHAYKNRIPTFETPVNYCFQDLKQFDKAAKLILPQLQLDSPFHVTQAHVQLAKIYVLKAKHEGTSLDVALAHARDAMRVSKSAGSSLIEFNARVSLMDTLQAANEKDEASAIATAILAEMDVNPNCGAKALHHDAAQKVIDANQSLACSM